MQDVVLIPTFDRPEMLWLCLSALEKCPEALKVKFLVRVDAHVGQYPPLQDIETVLRKFPLLDINLKVREPHAYHGNSYNVLVGYTEALLHSMRFVFMIEDDVLVDPSFFRWHYKQHTKPHTVVSIGVLPPPHKVYTSLGVCFNARFIPKIAAHAKPEYFGDMRGYCQRTFPPSPFDVEQDGLIARLLDNSRAATMWPEVPVAQHVGWYGYHRTKSIRPTGSLEERFEHIKRVLENDELLNRHSKDFKDVRRLVKSSCN